MASYTVIIDGMYIYVGDDFKILKKKAIALWRAKGKPGLDDRPFIWLQTPSDTYFVNHPLFRWVAKL